MKKTKIISIMLIMLMLFASCEKQPEKTTDEPPKIDEASSVHVVMPHYTYGKLEEENCEYASSLLNEAGFEVTFEVFDPGDAKSTAEAYENHIRENLNEDTVYIVPEEMADVLAEDGILAEHTVSGKDVSYKIEQGSWPAPLNRYALLIRNDIYDKYKPELNTGSETVEFLNKLKTDDPNQVPCATITFLYDRMYHDSGYLALQLFMPEYGWYSLDDVMKGGNSLDVWSSMDETQIIDIYSSEDAKRAVTAYSDLIKNGLLDYYTKKMTWDLSVYPTLLVNTEDYYATLMLANNPDYAALDLSEYYINILYKNTLPEVEANSVPDRSYVSIAGKDANIGEYLRFLEWLDNEENYELFTKGKGDSEGYEKWEQLIYFENADYQHDAKLENIPINLYEEVAEIEYPFKSRITKEKSSEINAKILADDDLFNAVNKNNQTFTAKMETLIPGNASKFELIIDQLFDAENYESMEEVLELFK